MCTQKLLECSVLSPGLPQTDAIPKDRAGRSGCLLLTAVYTHLLSSHGRFLQSTGTELSRRAVLEPGTRNAGCTRPWQACLVPAGCNPSSWSSAGYLRHTNAGGGEEVLHRTHLGPGLLSHYPSPSQFRALRGQQIRPTHLHRGRFFNPCPVCTHLLPPAPLKTISLIIRDRLRAL